MTDVNQTAHRPGYAELFLNLSQAMPLRGSHAFDPGLSATLRRLDPETEFSTPALVRVLVRAGVPHSDLRDEEQARAWAAVVQAMALMAHAGLKRGARVGKVLAEVNLSENRLARLLTARGESLRAQALRTVRIVAAAGKEATLDLLLELILIDSRSGQDEWAESVRLRIVEDFERATLQAEASASI